MQMSGQHRDDISAFSTFVAHYHKYLKLLVAFVIVGFTGLKPMINHNKVQLLFGFDIE
jgi:hypothetical protein